MKNGELRESGEDSKQAAFEVDFVERRCLSSCNERKTLRNNLIFNPGRCMIANISEIPCLSVPNTLVLTSSACKKMISP